MSTVLSKFFRVRPEDQIFLKITIGHAQIGTTMVSLAGEQLAGNLSMLPRSKNAALNSLQVD